MPVTRPVPADAPAGTGSLALSGWFPVHATEAGAVAARGARRLDLFDFGGPGSGAARCPAAATTPTCRSSGTSRSCTSVPTRRRGPPGARQRSPAEKKAAL
ncbi:hypothetical protein [Streptomyces dysideae]|uniref:hypothetical protein n=1 Tax=Streptomyces dysideae TaxID=909626 RepID=UPI000AAB947D|nr:hypothetical protein [Streptomyces dysideae]